MKNGHGKNTGKIAVWVQRFGILLVLLAMLNGYLAASNICEGSSCLECNISVAGCCGDAEMPGGCSAAGCGAGLAEIVLAQPPAATTIATAALPPFVPVTGAARQRQYPGLRPPDFLV